MSAKRRNKHKPLSDEYTTDTSVRAYARRKSKRSSEEASEDPAEYLDDRLSKKILEQAQEQQDDVLLDQALSTTGTVAGAAPLRVRPKLLPQGDDDDEAAEEDDDMGLADPDAAYQHLAIDEGDERAMQAFMTSEAPQRVTLADLIMAKIKDRQTEIATQVSETERPQLPPKVLEVYAGVGQILSRYRSGKLPKAFKIIPKLHNWEEIVYLTDPDGWTAAAMFAATRLFASNLKEKMAQRFYNLVLLPRVRDDISEFKRLNFHLYMAVKKAIYKPGAFFKGFLLPLCEGGDCSLREAVIIGGILVRKSIPVLHSSAAMLKMAEMPYSGATSIFLRVLLDKKYSLPFRVIDAVVAHFYRFTTDHRELPVLWHQCLLVFVQRYKEDITSEQKTALLDVLRTHNHPKITHEIRREIVSSRSRDNVAPMEEQDVAMG